MKNSSFWFIFIASVTLLVLAFHKGKLEPIGPMIVFSPLSLIAMVLSGLLKNRLAHVLNLLPAALFLLLPCAILIGGEHLVFRLAGLFLIGGVALWLAAPLFWLSAVWLGVDEPGHGEAPADATQPANAGTQAARQRRPLKKPTALLPPEWDR